MADTLVNAFRFARATLNQAKPPAATLVAMFGVQQARKGFAIAKQERDAWWKLVGEAPRRIAVPSTATSNTRDTTLPAGNGSE